MIKLTGRAGGVDVPVRYDYRRIMDDIRSRIDRGEWAPGFKLPTPQVMGRDLYGGVSAGTVRRATDALQLLGVLEGHQGVGVFVADRPLPDRE